MVTDSYLGTMGSLRRKPQGSKYSNNDGELRQEQWRTSGFFLGTTLVSETDTFAQTHVQQALENRAINRPKNNRKIVPKIVPKMVPKIVPKIVSKMIPKSSLKWSQNRLENGSKNGSKMDLKMASKMAPKWPQKSTGKSKDIDDTFRPQIERYPWYLSILSPAKSAGFCSFSEIK